MSSSKSGSSSAKRTRKCGCGVPVAEKRSWTVDNPGRKFIACKFYDKESGHRGCELFDWVDQGSTEWQKDTINQLVLEKQILKSQNTLLKREISRHQEDKLMMISEIEELRSGGMNDGPKHGIRVAPKSKAFVIVVVILVISLFCMKY
ncbi:uncharacterized protein LOC125494780 [Beta vulgaris subsp. vulgaris]|uniref:uncharacterized protein LOC125494780 n=1 Tax=Beta vulgaris subsp. vulgaris TaxID=3555 RepID=UPI002036A085|nr:uncharacterized protein LOC125494780 [Beta vulgaris subsp. vulgaris]